MDAKITKVRLSRMLSYDWLKIIGLAAALIFVWVMVFTMTATRIQPQQQFSVCNYMGNVSWGDEFTNAYFKSTSGGVFSHEVMETGYVDLAAQDQSTAYQLLEARMATEEIDMIFVSQQGNPSTATEEVGSDGSTATVYQRTYLESLLISRGHEMHKMDEFFSAMESYLNGYYGGNYKTGELDTQKVEADFRARVVETKDKRYKKESEIQSGVSGEVERVQKYRQALVDFNEYLEKGYVRFTTTKYTDETTPAYSFEREYSINICPETAPQKMQENLSRLVGYLVEEKDENGNEQTVVSARDMNVCFVDCNGDDGFQFEPLVYLTHLIKSVLPAA